LRRSRRAKARETIGESFILGGGTCERDEIGVVR
jgi:hypothetical protein